MSEPLHMKIGRGSQAVFCAPMCPACRKAGSESRAAERRATLRGAQADTLLDELKRRIGDLATENSELRTAAQTVEDNTTSHRQAQHIRQEQIKNLDRIRRTLEVRVREFRERVARMGGNGESTRAIWSDNLILASAERKLKDLRNRVADLESTASQQSESLSKVSTEHEAIFSRIGYVLGISTEGLTAHQAVLRLATEYKNVGAARDQYSDQLQEMERDLKNAQQDNGVMAAAMERMRKEVEQLRTAQVPRWYPVGTNPEGFKLELHTAYHPPESVEALESAGPEVTWYLWRDTDGDVWVWDRSQWVYYSPRLGRGDGIGIAPSKHHGPYYPVGLVRPEETTPEELENLLDAPSWARSYVWEDKDGDSWTWGERRWNCAYTIAQPTSNYGPYTRAERVTS